MGWGIGFSGGRDIGYSVPAVCDQPNCKVRIDRGLSYRCGNINGDDGCGLYFCGNHLGSGLRNDGENDEDWSDGELCAVCRYNFELGEDRWQEYKSEYTPKLDVIEWVLWKLNHPSWRKWRNENRKTVRGMQKRVVNYVEKQLLKGV